MLQRRIQTTSTYVNAEVTFSVVKLFKNTVIPIFSTKSLSSFLLPIEKVRTVCNFQSMKTPVELNSLLSEFFCYITWFVIKNYKLRKSQVKGLPWLFCRSCRTSLPARHAVKTVCSRNIRKLINNQENI